MRRQVATGLATALLAVRAYAADFTTQDEWELPARAPAIVKVILAYASTCDHSCRYRAPHVVRTAILKQERQPDSFYVWTLVHDVQDGSWFSHVSVARGTRTAHVEIRMVPPDRARELETATGEHSTPLFDAALATYDLEEMFAGDRFVHTRVVFRNTLSASGLTGLVGGALIRRRMAEAETAVYWNLSAAGPP